MPSQSAIDSRRSSDAKKRPGVIQQDDDLDYLYIGDLEKIYQALPEFFAPVFPDAAFFESMLGIVVRYRNTPSHGRGLVPFELDLLRGAAGYLANQTALYRDDKDDADSHYPSITLCRDSHNIDLTVGGLLLNPGGINMGFKWGPKLDVGSRVLFTCAGVNPRAGTELTWQLRIGKGIVHSNATVDSAQGDQVTLTWNVTEEHVSTEIEAQVFLASTSKYHRETGFYDPYDDRRLIRYFVRPPAHG